MDRIIYIYFQKPKSSRFTLLQNKKINTNAVILYYPVHPNILLFFYLIVLLTLNIRRVSLVYQCKSHWRLLVMDMKIILGEFNNRLNSFFGIFPFSLYRNFRPLSRS
jgi:hypothetical protein